MPDLSAAHPNVTVGDHTYNGIVMAARHALFEASTLARAARTAGEDPGLLELLGSKLGDVVADQNLGAHGHHLSWGACACGLVCDPDETTGHLDFITMLPADRFVRLLDLAHGLAWEAVCATCGWREHAKEQPSATRSLAGHTC